MLTCGSPWLIAAYRVLHRQSVPWHPPCALVRLIFAVTILFLRLKLAPGLGVPFACLIEHDNHCVYLFLLNLYSTGIVPVNSEALSSYFSLCSFQGACSAASSTLSGRSYAPAGSASRLSSCASRPSSLPHEPPVFASEVSLILIKSPILQNDTVFQSSSNSQIVSGFSPVFCVALSHSISYILHFRFLLASGCST